MSYAYPKYDVSLVVLNPITNKKIVIHLKKNQKWDFATILDEFSVTNKSLVNIDMRLSPDDFVEMFDVKEE